ncbi:XkdX family protein [Bacillus cereus]|nr:XkdX family protein [Bacillus cereus]EJS63486.1 hypothetical protein ICY_05323 [Bacillus cereus BAG2X1-3]
MNWFETVKLYYDWECYDDNDVFDYYKWGYITAEQFTEITGKEIPVV